MLNERPSRGVTIAGDRRQAQIATVLFLCLLEGTLVQLALLRMKEPGRVGQGYAILASSLATGKTTPTEPRGSVRLSVN